MTRWVGKLFRKLMDYYEIANTGPILRRYVILGVFDGILIVLTIILATWIKRLEPEVTWTSGVSGIIGISIASLWNTIQAEWHERYVELRRIERYILRSLRGTLYEKAYLASIILSTIAHTLSPLVGLAPLTIYKTLHDIGIDGLVPSITTSLTILLLLGLMYRRELGTLHSVKSGIFMMIAGLLAVAITLIIFGAKP